MADVFTIDDLNALATLTTADEIPVWDAEASGEPTKKITASNLAASVKSLGNLIGTGDLDSTPTSGSNKAVTSGGVYTAIQQSTAWVKIADIATSANTVYDNTVSVSYPSNCKEVMVTLQRYSNGRTFASTVLPITQFLNGAAYAGGSYILYSGLMSNNSIGIYVNAAVIYTSATSIEIAVNANSEPIRVRVFAR